MSAELTPLEVLDDAVRAFSNAVEDNGEVAGWVLSFQLTALRDRPGTFPLVSRPEYTLSPSTTGELAVGLLNLTSTRISNEILNPPENDD